MTKTKEFDQEEKISLEENEEDENFSVVRQSLDSMVSRRAKKYKNYSHPCLKKSTENLLINDKLNEQSDKIDNQKMESSKTTKETTKENNKETIREYRVIHRPPLPPTNQSSAKLIKSPNFNEFQVKTSNFNDLIDNILSSNTNIREYLRELRKNSELDYLLLSKILEKTLVPKSNVYVQTVKEPIKTFRSIETNTDNPILNNKQTQTRESRILSYKILETENIFEKLKLKSDFYSNSNYEIKRTSDLRLEEPTTDNKIIDNNQYFEETRFQEEEEEEREETTNYESTTNYCLDCNQKHNTRNKTIKIEDKFINNQDKIQLWNNLLQIDNNSEFSEDNSQLTNSKNDQTTEFSENQSLLSDDQFSSVSTKKSKKSYSSIKSTQITKTKSSKSTLKTMKDELLNEREIDLIERYKRIKDFKSKYELEKQEFIELRKQFKNLRKKLNDKNELKLKNKLEFDDYHQPINNTNENNKKSIKEQKKISFNDYHNNDNNIPKYTRFQCKEHYDLPACDNTSIDESELTTIDDEDVKDDDEEEESYLTDSEYSILDNHQTQKNSTLDKNVEFIDKKQLVDNQNTVKTESKILIETTNLKKKEISEISSQTELTKDGFLSRKTQVTNVKKVPVLVPINYNNQFNTQTPDPIITSPTSTATAANTPSATLQRKSNRKKHRSNTIEIHSITPSTNPSTRPTSAIDLNQIDDQNELNNNKNNLKTSNQIPNQTKGNFFTNSYSESELNAMKKDKNFILNEQLNFGISEPFMAYDSNIYDDKDNQQQNKHTNKISNDSSKSLKINSFQRKPNFNKRFVENSNLQQIVEWQEQWQETNCSTVTNEINSEPFKCDSNNSQSAKTKSVSLTTETTLQNNGNQRTIETKSKAIREFDLNKENDSNDENYDGYKSTSRCSSVNTVKNKINNNQDAKEDDEETSFNPKTIKKELNDKQNKCNKCDQQIKKKNLTKLSRSKKEELNLDDKMYKTIKKSSNYEERINKEEEHYNEQLIKKNNQNDTICVNNVNLDFDYMNLKMPNQLLNKFNDHNLIDNYKKIPNYLFQSYDNKLDKNFDIDFIDSNLDKRLENNENNENNKSNQLNDNLSKLSFDSGHSSTMSSSSYQTKNLKNNNLNKQNSFKENENLKLIDSSLNEDNCNISNYDEIIDYKLNQNDNNSNNLLNDEEADNDFSKSLVPSKLIKGNIAKNTEIINRITKTTYPDSIRKKKIKKKKFVFEQQLNSPSTNQEQNDCKITSLITMEIPYNLKMKSKCSKCYKNRNKKLNDHKSTNSIQNSELEQNSTSLSSNCSSETDSLINEDDLKTLTNFQKFRPILVNSSKDDDQTTWQYSLDCNCFNGVNASIRTTVTQFHNQNDRNLFDNNYQKEN